MKNVLRLKFFSISHQKNLIYDIQDLKRVKIGDPGIHNICVCAIHPNNKLKWVAVERTIHYIDVIEVSACSV